MKLTKEKSLTNKTDKIQKVIEVLDNFKKSPLNEKMVIKLFYIQDLMEEL